MIKVDAMGDACPIPVVKTKQALEALTAPDSIVIRVDNETAVQNLTRFAKNRGLAIRDKTIGKNEFEVVIDVSRDAASSVRPQVRKTADECACSAPAAEKTVVVLSSDRMGSGEDELGRMLMKSFIYALSQQDHLPDTILFYNGGVRLACTGSPALGDLKEMASRGVALFSCGTCLNFYGLSDTLEAGEMTNMYDIVAKMSGAGRIIKP